MSLATRTMSDTGNHRSGDGYERTIVYRDWDDKNPDRLARTHVRVDRRPELSFARVAVWVDSTGWNEVTAIGQEEFWENLPGYTRGQTIMADRDMLNLSEDLMAALAESGV